MSANSTALPIRLDEVGLGLQVRIRPYKSNFWEYQGTRTQLEAEGVIPPGTVWPKGSQGQSWEAGRFEYSLRRCRPDGMKGPMKIWTNGDWWSLRCELVNGPDYATISILEKKADLVAALYRQSPAGRIEWNVQCRLYWRAYDDKAFQAFKSICMPKRKKPGSKPELKSSDRGAK